MNSNPPKATGNAAHSLVQQALSEEKAYNWNKAVDLLQQAENLCGNEDLKALKNEIHLKLGELYQIAADCEKNQGATTKYIDLSKANFKMGLKISKELGDKGKINLIHGYLNLIDYIHGNTHDKTEKLLENAKDYFKKARTSLKQTERPLDSLKMMILECRTSSLNLGEKLLSINEQVNLEELANQCKDLLTKIWDQNNDHDNLPEIYLYHALMSLLEFFIWIIAYSPSDKINTKDYVVDCLSLIRRFIDNLEGSGCSLALFNAYVIRAYFDMNYAIYYQNIQYEQTKYLKRGDKWLKKAENLIDNVKINLSLGVFYYTRFNLAIRFISLGLFAKEFKDILEDMNLCVELIAVSHPNITCAHLLCYAAGIFLIASITSSIPDNQRLDLARRAQNLSALVSKRISIEQFRIYEVVLKYFSCAVFAIMGDLTKQETQKERLLEQAATIFNEIATYKNPRITNTQVFYQCVIAASKSGTLLAKNPNISIDETVNYYQIAVDLLLLLNQSNIMKEAFYYLRNLFAIGHTYYELGQLTNDPETYKNSIKYYILAIDYCRNKGYLNLIGSAFVNLARIEDRLGNYLSAAEKYKKAKESFNESIKTFTDPRLSKKLKKWKQYMSAYELIETAKSYHIAENHSEAQKYYEKASKVLKNIRTYNYEAPFFAAWALLEHAETFSKQNNHLQAAEAYLKAKQQFLTATETLDSFVRKRKYARDRERINQLIQVGQLRATYCDARNQIEVAREESKKGNHLFAAELYNKASTLFKELAQKFELKREKDELKAIYYFCNAWEQMERAEVEKDPLLYAHASNLFKKASNIFPKRKMKTLSLGNSIFCSALECGSLFDKTTDLNEKLDCYKKIKIHLRESSKNYQLGGFAQDAQWALATSTFFDGIWHLFQSDNAIELPKKSQFLSIAKNYLSTALELFEASGYGQKVQDIQKYLEMIENEISIHTLAMDVIEKPAISESTVGISAPSCPVEISSAINIDEMQRHDLRVESETNWFKRLHHLYLFLSNGICIYDEPFKSETDVDSQLVSTGLTGISSLVKELTKSETKIKIVEQEEITIILEHGQYLSGALIAEENLITLRNKLVKLIQEVEAFFQEELENFTGEIDTFSKVRKFIPKIFSI